MPSGRTWVLRWRGSPRRGFDLRQILDVLLHVDCFLVHLPREVIDTQFHGPSVQSLFLHFPGVGKVGYGAKVTVVCSPRHQSLNVHLQDASWSYMNPAQS